MEIQWSLVFFAAFICWGAGTYLAAVAFRALFAASERIMRPAFVLAAAAVVVGAVSSMTHLGHLDRIFGVLSNPGSGIFVEGLSSALLVLLVIVYLVAAARKASPGTLRALALVGVVPALVVTFAVGSSYLMVARPAWNVFALPLISITAALSMGAVTVLAIDALVGRGVGAGAGADEADAAAGTGGVGVDAGAMAEAGAGTGADGASGARAAKRMGAAALALIGVQAVAVVAYVASVAAAPYQEGTRSAARMLMGDMAPLFWAVVVVLGIVVPSAIVVLQRRGSDASGAGATGSAAATASTSNAVAGRQSKTAFALVIAVVCMVAAVIAFRVVMFSLGSSIIDFGFTL